MAEYVGAAEYQIYRITVYDLGDAGAEKLGCCIDINTGSIFFVFSFLLV